jgi:Phosphoribosyl-ATP pyrophosphohydrolase
VLDLALLPVVRRAISDPGSVTARRPLHEDWDGSTVMEPMPVWQARAVVAAIEPFLSTATPERMLRELHASKRVHGGLMPARPTTDIPLPVASLRQDLLAEEAGELAGAVQAGDIVKIADGLADVVYVAVGTAVVYGIPFDAVLAEVHRSNMSKVNTPDEAKLVKGPGYQPPDIAAVLETGQEPPAPTRSPSPAAGLDGLVMLLTGLVFNPPSYRVDLCCARDVALWLAGWTPSAPAASDGDMLAGAAEIMPGRVGITLDDGHGPGWWQVTQHDACEPLGGRVSHRRCAVLGAGGEA